MARVTPRKKLKDLSLLDSTGEQPEPPEMGKACSAEDRATKIISSLCRELGKNAIRSSQRTG